MKRLYKFLLVFVIIGLTLSGYVFHIFYSTGFFREINSQRPGEILKSIDLPGVEDMQVSYIDSFLLLSSDDRAARRDGNPRRGDLYWIDLRDTALRPICLTTNLDIPFYPHGISMYPLGERNYRVFVINHGSEVESIELFDLIDTTLTYRKSLQDKSLIHPNDLVAIDAERFYFTNDHGYPRGWRRLAEDYLGLALSNVVYFDGLNWQEAANQISYANGINLDKKRNLLFVASPRYFLINVFHIESDQSLTWIENIDCQTGVDNIEFDQNGKLWIGCHPSLLTFSAYAKGKKDISPSEVITIEYRGKGDYTVETIFLDDGQLLSAATVASVFGNWLFLGNVMDDHFIVLNRD